MGSVRSDDVMSMGVEDRRRLLEGNVRARLSRLDSIGRHLKEGWSVGERVRVFVVAEEGRKGRLSGSSSSGSSSSGSSGTQYVAVDGVVVRYLPPRPPTASDDGQPHWIVVYSTTGQHSAPAAAERICASILANTSNSAASAKRREELVGRCEGVLRGGYEVMGTHKLLITLEDCKHNQTRPSVPYPDETGYELDEEKEDEEEDEEEEESNEAEEALLSHNARLEKENARLKKTVEKMEKKQAAGKAQTTMGKGGRGRSAEQALYQRDRAADREERVFGCDG
jgi:hypothetical protein